MQSSILLYQTADADITVETPSVNKHLTNNYKFKEISKSSTISILETVQKEGKRDIVKLSDFDKVINKIN